MKFGAHLPVLDFGEGVPFALPELRDYARSAERLGYETLTVNDHFVFARPWLDGPTALAAVLGETRDIGLGTSVALPVVRGPVALAKTLGAIDLLSGGRLTIGVGPGSSARDYAAVGLEYEERWQRLDEAVIVLRALLRGDNPPPGRFYALDGLVLAPGPARPGGPPIWIGSWGSKAGLRRVARLGDGWLASGYNTTPATFATARADLRDHLADAGRPADDFPNGIATMWTFVTGDRSEADRLLRDVLAPMLKRDPDVLGPLLTIGSPEDCAERLSAYAAAGAQRVFIWPLARAVSQLSTFMERVVPLVVEA
jgi:alkanesulfonate monooxygenase SsuD/methylene tetrahydromethanopterin reductase-like flavin-dependent oxidoreductase (luciferase family)